MEPVNLFVFGAGYSALAAIGAFRSPEFSVTATTRSWSKARALADAGVEPVIFDGEAPGKNLADALASATHLLVSIAPSEKGDPALLFHAADVLVSENLKWIGYYSTIGVYGDSGGGWIDETAPTEPLSPRNRYRLQAELAWRDLAAQKGVPLAILRLAGIYGPERSPFEKLKSGKARRIDKPGQVFNRIHVADIGEITARAAQARLDGIFNICDDEPAPPQDVIAHAAELLGIEPPPLIDFETADLSPMARTFYAGNRRVSNAAIKKALGYTLAYPDYRAGHAAIANQHRD